MVNQAPSLKIRPVARRGSLWLLVALCGSSKAPLVSRLTRDALLVGAARTSFSGSFVEANLAQLPPNKQVWARRDQKPRKLKKPVLTPKWCRPHCNSVQYGTETSVLTWLRLSRPGAALPALCLLCICWTAAAGCGRKQYIGMGVCMGWHRCNDNQTIWKYTKEEDKNDKVMSTLTCCLSTDRLGQTLGLNSLVFLTRTRKSLVREENRF